MHATPAPDANDSDKTEQYHKQTGEDPNRFVSTVDDSKNLILQHDDESWRDSLLLYMAKLCFATSTLYIGVNLLVGFPHLALFNAAFSACYLAFLIDRKKKPRAHQTSLVLFLATAQIATTALVFLPTTSGAHYFLMVIPLFALTASRPNRHVAPLIISATGILVGGFLEYEQNRYVAPLQHYVDHINLDGLRALAGVLSVVLSFTICRAFYRQLGTSHKLFSEQQLLIRQRMMLLRDEESKELRMLLGNVRTPIIGLNHEHRIDEWNGAATDQWGIEPSAAIGQPINEILNPSEPESLLEQIAESSFGRSTTSTEYSFQLAAAQHQVLVSSTPRTGPTDKPIGCWLICHDICALHQALDEKELLLKEVHHRVKNNLQIISSLINMQRDIATSEEARVPLAESASRVRAMALIHEHLYSGSSMARVDFAVYAKDLTNHLQTLLSPSAELHVAGQSIELPIDMAVPCGLILNELVTNSLKYGVSARGHCRIQVAIQLDNNDLLLSVADQGPGLPKDFQAAAADSLGFQLVLSLVRQLRANFAHDNENGASFQLRAPIPSAKSMPQQG